MVAIAGLLVLPVASCRSGGSEKTTTVEVTGIELLRNRSTSVGEARHSVEYLRWLAATGPSVPIPSPADAPPSDPPPERGGVMFEGSEQWLRVLFASVVLLALSAAALPPRRLRGSLLAGLAAGGLLVFLRLTEDLVRHVLHGGGEAAEFRWEAGSYVALLALGATAVVGPILRRRRATSAAARTTG
jgi:hypothetical protein